MQVEDLKCSNVDNDKKYNPEKDLSQKLKNYIIDIAEKEGYLSYEFNVKVIPCDGGNYLSTTLEVDVSGTTKKEKKTINIFVKQTIPIDDAPMFRLSAAYLNEMFTYNELFKMFSQLQDEAKIPINERFNIIKSYDESNSEFIILENIAKKGFRTLDRFDIISMRFAEKSIQQLAKFHGLSFVLQNKNKEYFDKKIKTLKTVYVFNDEWKMFAENFCKISMSHVNSETKKKIEGLVPIIKEKYPRYYMDEAPVMCLCHGDYRPNNIMLKNDEKYEVVPIDYQLIHYGCPINDIIFFLYCATDRKFRRDHVEDIMNMYYETLKKFLVYFDMDVENYFPKKTFEVMYRERMDYGLMTAVLFLPMVLASGDDIPDFSKTSPMDLAFNTDKRFKSRMEGIVDEFCEFGYF